MSMNTMDWIPNPLSFARLSIRSPFGALATVPSLSSEPEPSVCRGKLMTLFAGSLFAIQHANAIASQCIFSLCNNFKVIRINTSRCMAKMVKHHIRGNVPFRQLVGETMRLPFHADALYQCGAEGTIAFPTKTVLPKPTSIVRGAEHLAPKTSDDFGVKLYGWNNYLHRKPIIPSMEWGSLCL